MNRKRMMRKSRFELPLTLLRGIAWCVMKPCFRFEVRNGEILERCPGPVILAGNHTGYLDSLAVLIAYPGAFRFLMTEEVFTWGLIGKLVRHANIIPLYAGREKRGLVDALRHLQQQHSICIFPEGKLTQDGQLNRLNEGVAFLQQKSGVPVIPFWIAGGFEAWPQHRPLPAFRNMVLQFGEPLEADLCQSRSEMVQTIEARMLAMRDELLHLADSTRLGSEPAPSHS